MNEKTAAMEEIQAQQGWTDETLFLFALRMLEANGLTHEFEELLQSEADDEDAELDDEVTAEDADDAIETASDPVVDDQSTPEVKPDWKHYIDHLGNVCPYCAGTDFDTGSFNSDAGYAWQSVTCTGCGHEWDDIYRLVEVDTKPEEGQHGHEENQN